MQPCFILTGASGAIGTQLLPSLMGRYPHSRVVALFRSRQAAEATAQCLPATWRERLQSVVVDLTHDDAVQQAVQQLPNMDKALAIHMAADVSWDKSAEQLAPLNVDGALRFAELLERVVREPKLVFVSTAFTRMQGWSYRNGYEETKAAAQRALVEGFGRRNPLITYSCSLVVGSSNDGSISRFHGIYPLIRFVARFNPPFVVGNKLGRFDLIPIDWAVQQLLHAVELLDNGNAPTEVVASAGDDRVSFERLVALAIERLNFADAAVGIEPQAPPPILKRRQWDFLKRSLHAWRPAGVNERDFRYFERLLDVYGQYAENDTSRPPLNVSTLAPSPETYLPRVVDFWLRTQHRPMAAKTVELTA